MRVLAPCFGLLFLTQGLLGKDWVPLGMLANRLPPEVFLGVPCLVFAVAVLVFLLQPIQIVLQHGRRVPAGSPPTPGCARGRFIIGYYDLELRYFRIIAVNFCNFFSLLTWGIASMVFSSFACAFLIQSGRLENGGAPLLQALLNFFLGFALVLQPLAWSWRQFTVRLIDRIIRRATPTQGHVVT